MLSGAESSVNSALELRRRRGAWHAKVHSRPLAIRWSGPKCTAEHATQVFAAYRTSLATLRAEQPLNDPF
nr:hypothetical protein CFP56_67907 [Quercus suber]